MNETRPESKKIRPGPDSPAGVVHGSPVVAVQLLDGETAVQELGQQLRVSLTGAAVEGEVVHPLTLPAEHFVCIIFFKAFLSLFFKKHFFYTA